MVEICGTTPTRRSIISAVAALGAGLGIGAASAADLAGSYAKAPVADPVYDWSGIFIGQHFEYLRGKTRVVDSGVLTEAGAPTSGFGTGLFAGYNWQRGPFVFGVEQDAGGLFSAVGHGIIIPPLPPGPPGPPGPAGPAGPAGPGAPTGPAQSNTYKINWDGHAVGKAGFAMDHWLFFATGGLSFAGFNFQEGVPVGAAPAGSLETILTGFSVGAGIEYAFSQHILGRLQYIYDDFGARNFTAIDGGIYHVNLTAQTVKGGVAWKW
jgi:outer membrane immunogenic protein